MFTSKSHVPELCEALGGPRCASVIGMMAHDPISGMVFAEAAGQASEPDLSAALSNPMAKPPRFGEPGFDESPAAAWCWRYYHATRRD